MKITKKAIFVNFLIGISMIVSLFIAFYYAGFPFNIVIETLRNEYPWLSDFAIVYVSGIFTISLYLYSIMGIFVLFCVSVWLKDDISYAKATKKGKKE